MHGIPTDARNTRMDEYNDIGSKDNEESICLTIYIGGDIIPFEQENTYARFFEDAKYQWLLLKK